MSAIRRFLACGAASLIVAACNRDADASTGSATSQSTASAVAGRMMLDPPSLDRQTLDELIAAREGVWRAFFQADSTRLVALLPDTMFAMGKHRADIIADAKGFAANGGRFVGISFTDDNFFVRGDVALVQSRYRVELTEGGKPAVMSGVAIELFERRNGKWINPSWHLDDDKDK